jgi:hypothetical protein
LEIVIMALNRSKVDWTLTTAVLTLGLTACGGHSKSDATSAQPTVTVSGTAAAGQPLVGSVTVRDAAGAIRTVPIGANGSYSVDVTGMTAPVMLQATGFVGATRYVVHSASATISSSGNVNITPLTDLIVANAAGQIAATYFSGASYASLTQAQLDAETASLRAKLLPVLSAMNVEASIDLLRTPFTPLASALDRTLDILRVSVDAAAQVATITNLVNRVTITDNLTTNAAAEAGSTPMTASGMGTAADDVPLIRKALTDFVGLYATSLPSASQVLPLLSSSFLNRDNARNTYANGMAQVTNLLGASVAALEILGIDYTNNGGANPIARIGFTILNSRGVEDSRSDTMQVIRESDGVWRLHGDQRVLDIVGHTLIVNGTGSSNCRASGIEFNIRDNDGSNSANISYLILSGPGLPLGGVKYRRPLTGGEFTPSNTGNPTWLPLTDTCNGNFGASGLSDAAIATIPDQAAYTIAAFAIDDSSVSLGSNGTYTEVIPKRALTRTELQAATTFPTIGAPTMSALATYVGGSLSISGRNANPQKPTWVYLGLTDGNGAVGSVAGDVEPSASGAFSANRTLIAPAVVSQREVRVATADAFNRTLLTILVP